MKNFLPQPRVFYFLQFDYLKLRLFQIINPPKTKIGSLMLLLFGLALASQAQSIIYVNAANGGTVDGTSFATGYPYLKDAINYANTTPAVQTIRVAQGTYYATGAQTGTDRNSSHYISRGGLEIYGGYNASTGQRDIASFPTVLSGNINTSATTDNSFHVITIVGLPINAGAIVIDGLTVEGGFSNVNNNSSSFTYGSISISDGYGAGVVLAQNNNVPITFNNCNIKNNTAYWGGGGMDVSRTSLSLEGCTITANNATASFGQNGGPGGVWAVNCSVVNVNKTLFAANVGQADGGGMSIQNQSNALNSTILSLTDCQFKDNKAGNGGGLFCKQNNTTYTISGALDKCVFEGNTASINGGAGLYLENCSPSVSNSQFNLNKLSNGDGAGIRNSQANPTINNCSFTRNYVGGNGYGAGIANSSSSPIITNCQFYGNKSLPGGGSIYNAYSSNTKVANSSFIADTTTYFGGSLYNAYGAANITYNNCLFYKNVRTQSNGSSAGVIDNYAGTASFINCVFRENKARTYSLAYNTSSGTLNFINCTIQGQVSTATGSAIFRGSGTQTNLSNSILHGNNGGLASTGGGTIKNSLVQGQSSTANGNLDGITDPLFVDITTPAGPNGIWGDADDGLRLQPCSKAINAGDNGLLPAGTSTDFGGFNRQFNGGFVDMGAYEYQAQQGANIGTLAVAGDVSTLNITTTNGTYDLITTDASCRLIASIGPNGTNPLQGVVNANVYIDPTVQFHNGSPYLQRHYEVSGSGDDLTSAEARLTLYFTQGEFSAFNSQVTSGLLPIDDLDNAGKTNLRVYQYHGDPTGGNTPGHYSGPPVVIDPEEMDIVWNASLTRWEVSFDITGFSGFFVGSVSKPLPVKLVRFTATESEGTAQLKWQTTSEVNASHFEIERSFDARSYHRIGEVAAYNGGANLQNYNYPDKDFTKLNATAYYRLRMVDTDGSFSYSRIVSLSKSGEPSRLFPNPVKSQDRMVLESTSSVEQIRIINQAGQRLQLPIRKIGEGQYEIQVGKTAPGLYILHTGERSHQFLVE